MRHGAHAEVGRVLGGRRSDIGLSDEGRAEVEVLARNLGGCGAVRVESSPRLRTRQTAEILGAALGLPVAVEDALDEIDFGNWSGRSFAELDRDPAWQRWNSARATAPTPGGETMAAAVARAAAHLDALGRAGETVLCVSHCDIIRGLVAHWLGLSLDNILRFEVGTASICWLAPDGQGGGQVLTLNGRS
ncbi:histidine phosphatase family protein [Paracoccus sp. S-4012]|nr:histidine phosphatase family protein [Paracoccus sp. S-4012]